jgi:hypothetical protein
LNAHSLPFHGAENAGVSSAGRDNLAHLSASGDGMSTSMGRRVDEMTA